MRCFVCLRGSSSAAHAHETLLEQCCLKGLAFEVQRLSNALDAAQALCEHAEDRVSEALASLVC